VAAVRVHRNGGDFESEAELDESLQVSVLDRWRSRSVDPCEGIDGLDLGVDPANDFVEGSPRLIAPTRSGLPLRG
jgi:hypothetical protein